MNSQPKSDGGTLTDFVAAADESVRDTLAAGKGLQAFLSTIANLTLAERQQMVDQAIKLLEGFYVHLPLKRAMHAVDPLQKLRLLKRRLPQLTSEIAFHHEMTNIFTSLRDLHTNYILPAHFAQMIAFLPFRVEACFENDERKYMVTQVINGFNHPTFVAGVKLTYWNGIPIDRAVEIAASQHAGSNSAARHARGVAGLTKRAMNIAPPPDEEWVTIGFEDLNKQQQEFRTDWTITRLTPEAAGILSALSPEAAAAYGLDIEGDTFNRINRMLFAQHVVAAERAIQSVRKAALNEVSMAMGGTADPSEVAAAAESAIVSQVLNGTESTMPKVFSAKSVEVDGRKLAYVRIYTFSVGDDNLFVNEFLRLIDLPEMPKNGLIIDVRGNGGGLIWAGERLLQLLTPEPIEPCRLQFINTPMNLALCEKAPGLKQWFPSLERALETGATFSAGFPITPPERCNDLGQRYYGPVVLITDARCYSTTDIFAAGFQDHKIGTVLGTDNNTGAGGANVWTLGLILQFFADSGLPAPLQPLPKGADMRVAIRRTLRVKGEAGTELEDLGVRPDKEHKSTSADALQSNLDLIQAAANILKDKPAYKFDVAAKRVGDRLQLDLSTENVKYVDVFVDRRALATRNVKDNQVHFDLPPDDEFAMPAKTLIELRGYDNNKVVCYRRLTV